MTSHRCVPWTSAPCSPQCQWASRGNWGTRTSCETHVVPLSSFPRAGAGFLFCPERKLFKEEKLMKRKVASPSSMQTDLVHLFFFTLGGWDSEIGFYFIYQSIRLCPAFLPSLTSVNFFGCCSCCSVTQWCQTLCDPMDCSTPDLPVLYHLLEPAQTHVHWVSDAFQPSRPLCPFSSCLLSFPAAGFFPVRQLFASGGQIKRLFSSSLLSAIRVVLSTYLRLLIFLPEILIPACASSNLTFHMRYSAYKLNKQGDNIWPWPTPFPVLSQSVVPCPVLTVRCLLTCIQILQEEKGGLVFPSL